MVTPSSVQFSRPKCWFSLSLSLSLWEMCQTDQTQTLPWLSLISAGLGSKMGSLALIQLQFCIVVVDQSVWLSGEWWRLTVNSGLLRLGRSLFNNNPVLQTKSSQQLQRTALRTSHQSCSHSNRAGCDGNGYGIVWPLENTISLRPKWWCGVQLLCSGLSYSGARGLMVNLLYWHVDFNLSQSLPCHLRCKLKCPCSKLSVS